MLIETYLLVVNCTTDWIDPAVATLVFLATLTASIRSALDTAK